MTETDKELILDLRVKGSGYKAIAAVLGISRDQVRHFCKHYGLEGSVEMVSYNIKERVKLKELCANCYKTINQKTTGRPRRFCKDKCRRAWWNKNRKVNVKKALNKEMENGI